MFVLGVTGGIGSGKTTACEMFEKLGARVLDADAIVRSLYEGGDVPRRIAERFGPGVLSAEGAVDRGALAQVVFSDASARRDLEAIVHPSVRARVEESLERWRAEGYEGLAVIDAALLVEASPPYPLDALLVVTAPAELRAARLEGRGVSRAEAGRRMRAQASEERRIARADFVIENRGSIEDLESEVRRVYAELARDGTKRCG
jgi:dephospho-CoA kinase